MIDEKLTPEGTETPAAAEEAKVEATQPETSVAPSSEPTTVTAVEAPATKGDAATTSNKTEDEMLFEAAMASLGGEEPGSVGSISKGERIEATVIHVEKDRVFVGLGTKSEGVVPLAELTDENLETAVGHVKPGDTFDVIVLKTSGTDGNAIVSKKRADFDLTWQRILDSFEEGRLFDAQVIDRVKGGLVVDIGVRGFVPATHVGSGKLRNIEKYVGQTLPVKIIEVDKERKKVVLSNKSAESEKREEVKDKIFTEVQPQDVLDGTVRRLTDYGAFVDLGGIDGLLHISEMSWVRIDHPKEVLHEGQQIKVMVLRLDQTTGRVSLGLRQVLPDPWNLIKENYTLGQKLTVKVSRIVQSGAFVRLPEGAEAFLPLSEINNDRPKKPQDVLEEGQDIEPIIIDLRTEERRMVLSTREGARPGQDYNRYEAAQAQSGGMQRGGPGMGGGDRRRPGGPMGSGGGGGDKRRGGKPRDGEGEQNGSRTPTGGATIGERLGMLKGFLRPEAEEPKKES